LKSSSDPADFDPGRVDSQWLLAWMTGRSLARGLPLPFADRGGWRAEIGSDSEQRRWVFPALCPELLALAREIAKPGLNLRAVATADEMRSFLPGGWTVQAQSFAMTGPTTPAPECELPAGYQLEMQIGASAMHAFILAAAGELVASGHAGVGEYAVVFDRIVTQPRHRRKGLGRAIMASLAAACQRLDQPTILVATEAGRQLYQAIGWRVVAPYASAGWTGDSPVQN
jgi:hypothetical protein